MATAATMSAGEAGKPAAAAAGYICEPHLGVNMYFAALMYCVLGVHIVIMMPFPLPRTRLVALSGRHVVRRARTPRSSTATVCGMLLAVFSGHVLSIAWMGDMCRSVPPVKSGQGVNVQR